MAGFTDRLSIISMLKYEARHGQKDSTRLQKELFALKINHDDHYTFKDESNHRPMVTSGIPEINLAYGLSLSKYRSS